MKKKSYTGISDYILQQPEEHHETLEKLRALIQKAAPKSEEVISYQMPAFKQGKIVVWFAGTKNHYGLYPYGKPIEVFKKDLEGYDTSKGTIRFSWDKPMPVKLITAIVKFRVKEIEAGTPSRTYPKKAAKKGSKKVPIKKK